MRGNVWICDYVETPFILGIFRPRIYMTSYISSEDARHVIAHEKAHIAHGDHVWKPLGFVILSVYWFNPVIWLAFILFSHDIEFACDERVLRAASDDSVKRGYSAALVNCSAPGRPITLCPLGFAEVSVKERVKDVLRYKKPTVWIMTAAVIAIFAAAATLLTSPLEKADEALYKRRTDYDDFSFADSTVYETSDNVILNAEIPEKLAAQGRFRDLREADFMVFDEKLYARNFLYGEEFVTDWTELSALGTKRDLTPDIFSRFLPAGAPLSGLYDPHAATDEVDGGAGYVSSDPEGNPLTTDSEYAISLLLNMLGDGACREAKWRESDRVYAFAYLFGDIVCLGYQHRDGLPEIYHIRGLTLLVDRPAVMRMDFDVDGDGEKDRVELSYSEKNGKNEVVLSGAVGGREFRNYLYLNTGFELGLGKENRTENGKTVEYLTLEKRFYDKDGNRDFSRSREYYLLRWTDDGQTGTFETEYGFKSYKGVPEEKLGDPTYVVSFDDGDFEPSYYSVKDVFMEDERYEYCLTQDESRLARILTADGRERDLREALADGIVDLDFVLEKYGFYWKIDKQTGEYICISNGGKVSWSSAGVEYCDDSEFYAENGYHYPFFTHIPDRMRQYYNTYGYTVFDIDGDGVKEYIAFGWGPNKEGNFPVTYLLFTVTVEQGGKREYFDIFDLGPRCKFAMRLEDDGRPYMYTYEEGDTSAPADRRVIDKYDLDISDGHVTLTKDGKPLPYWDGNDIWGY